MIDNISPEKIIDDILKDQIIFASNMRDRIDKHLMITNKREVIAFLILAILIVLLVCDCKFIHFRNNFNEGFFIFTAFIIIIGQSIWFNIYLTMRQIRKNLIKSDKLFLFAIQEAQKALLLEDDSN